MGSVRQAASASDVSPFVVRRWISQGCSLSRRGRSTRSRRSVTHKIQVRNPRRRTARARCGIRVAVAPPVAEPTWRCPCSQTGESASTAARRCRQQLLDAIYAGQPFREALRDLGLTSNQVWGLALTDQEWSEKLEAALTAARRQDLRHGTTAAYVRGCVCKECREHQRVRMTRNR